MSVRFLLAFAVFGFLVSDAALAVAADGDQVPFNPDAIPSPQAMPGAGESIVPQDAAQSAENFLAIYGGSTKGTYFYVASALCAAVEANFKRHHIRCVSLRSQGDASNVSLMNQGRAQFIIIQSNTNENAASGSLPLPQGRSVMSLHDELGVLVVGRRSDIHSVADLRGQRVNIGPEGTSSRALWDGLLAAEGITRNDLGTVLGAAQDLNQRGLCDDYMDAFGLWIGHPATPISTSVANCGARVVGMRSPGIEKMVASVPYFFWGEVPARTYPGQNAPISSYGFKATLVADARVNPDLVYWLVRSVQENLSLFRSRHPTLTTVDARAMFEKANFLPFHDGAARYWREVGWLRDEAAK